MPTLKHIVRGGEGASPLELRLHQIYLGTFLTLFAVANGILALALAACSYAPLENRALFCSYFRVPYTVLLNLLPALALVWLGYFLTRRAWAAYLISAVPTVALALVNYYKIQLRGDPFLASDFRLARTAGGILGHYSLDLTPVVLVSAMSVVLMLLFTIFFMPNGLRGKWLRLGGTLVCLALLPLLYFGVYKNDNLYLKTKNNDAIRSEWSDVEVFVSRGFWYPFLRSVSDAFPKPPAGYDAHEARELLAQYEGGDISPEKKVTVVGVMLEAFADLSDYPSLAALDGVQSLYAPLHELEEKSVSGELLTNIFAGGTVDSEWGFLTGYSHHDEFRRDVDSYVRYFGAQGYDTLYRHPGYGWFYNRSNVNQYLGFDESMFTDNGFGEIVNVDRAPWHSDKELFDFLYGELAARGASSAPLFSFSVSYQNHGPYESDPIDGGVVSSSGAAWSAESRGILDHYLAGVGDTISELTRFVGELEGLEQPVVLVVFGDHKPWLGNDNSVYEELGVSFDLGTKEGFYNYYATPYFIWANQAAKAALGNDFTGDGGDFSPCFLMPKLFDLCSWEGPGFMQLAREMRAVTPLVHERELFLMNGEPTDTLSPEAAEQYRQYRGAEYWREQNGLK